MISPDNNDAPLAVVAGGTRGIGLAVGELLFVEGWRVVLADRDIPGEADPDRFDCRSADISDSAVVDRLAVVDFGRLIAEGEPKAIMASKEVQEIYLGIEVDGDMENHG